MKLSRQVILWSVILYFALSIPISLIHELGHVLVCTSSGFDYAIWIDVTGGHMVCSGRPADTFAYNAMGGVLGVVGSISIMAVWLFAKRHYAILAVGLAYFVDQSAKVILEGIYTPVYASGEIDAYITALQVASWLGFMIYFARIKEPAKVAASDI
ncbi:MAG: hypothetical protein AB1351_10090 [Thermoproteota archaeon]